MSVVRGLAAVLSLVLLATTGWGWYLSRVAEASVSRTDAIPSTGNAGFSGQAMNLLLVGSDSRADLTPEQRKELHTGDNGGLNTDTMILVHVPDDGSRASFVSFPRDSYVEVPGHGNHKLNAAYALGHGSVDDDADDSAKQAGGAQLLVQTISQLTGLKIDHYAEVDLLGFFNLSSVVGGVEVNLCEAVDDEKSGAVFPAGPQVISGADAVRFVRQRYGLPRGDFDRIVRQQVFMAGVLRKVLSDNVLLNPATQRELVQAAAGSLTLDRSLDMMQLAQQMQSVTAGSIQFQTIPNQGTDRDPDAGSIVRLEDEGTLHAFFAALSADTSPAAGSTPSAAAGASAAASAPAPAPTVAPSSVRVQVLNGVGTSGLAGTAATELQGAGFVVAGTGNADSADYATTVIRHAPGDEALAQALADRVPGAGTQEDAGAVRGTVQLVLGADWQGLGERAGGTPLVRGFAAQGATTPRAAPAPAAPTAPEAGETARTAADTSCIN